MIVGQSVLNQKRQPLPQWVKHRPHRARDSHHGVLHEHNPTKKNSFDLILIWVKLPRHQASERCRDTAQRVRNVAEDAHGRDDLQQLGVIGDLMPVEASHLRKEDGQE